MTATERATYWIEHVLKYEGDHLHSYALDMPWYQYPMLDILFFVLAMFLVVVSAFCMFVIYIKNITQ